MLLQTHQTLLVNPAVVAVVCRRIAAVAAVAVPVAPSLISLRNQQKEPEEEGGGLEEAGMGKIREGVDDDDDDDDDEDG